MLLSAKDPSLLIVAGEASGDLHGAHIIKDLLKVHPNVTCYAMGSQHLANAGANIIVDSKELAVVGFVEVLSKLKLIRQAFRRLKKIISLQKPSLIILIDYPGFNLRLAKIIKKINPACKIIYYISPQIWAWRYHRIHIIKKLIDLMVVIFPFEVPIYQKENVPVKLVSHPLLDKVMTHLSTTESRKYLGFNATSKVIGLMPGSRQSEIKYLLPTLLESAQILKQQFPEAEFLLPLAATINRETIESFLRNSSVAVKIIDNDVYGAIEACDAVIVASGTATLELALLAKPMVIVYKTSTLSHAIAKKLVKVKHIGLCNIVAQERIVKELVQHEASPINIAQEINRLLVDDLYRTNIINKLKQTASLLNRENADDSLINIVSKMII